MPWLQLEIETTLDTAERLSDLLTEAGASAVTLQDAADQALFEPPLGTTPLWQATRVIGLFGSEQNIPEVLGYIQQQLADIPLPPWHLNPLEDRDWVRAWMDDFKPMQFGQHLWICPSGYPPPDPEATNILLDPGLAFGTGTHPTTAMCLRWLDAHPPRGLALIDYGCGSGILAIAACLLGARRAEGIDMDPQALIASRDNAAKNQVSEQFATFLPKDFISHPVPLLLANILAGPLIELAPLFARLVIPQGQIVLSGILETQAQTLIEAYNTAFTLECVDQQEEWVCLAGTRKSH